MLNKNIIRWSMNLTAHSRMPQVISDMLRHCNAKLKSIFFTLCKQNK